MHARVYSYARLHVRVCACMREFYMRAYAAYVRVRFECVLRVMVSPLPGCGVIACSKGPLIIPGKALSPAWLVPALVRIHSPFGTEDIRRASS